MATTQATILIVSYALLSGFALHAIFTGNYRKAIWLILFLALALRIFMAGDLFLHDWDERFHAVIAKNIWSSPVAPQLYTDGVLEYNFARWSESDLWLSKPFLPFWILGSSIALFGNNEFGLRLPSVLIGLTSVWFTYKIGRRLFGNKPGLIAAFLHAIHGMILEMSGGLISSDHVDTLFTLLFQLGIWVYIKSWRKPSVWWLILPGFIAGLAFLTKWIMAFFLLLIIAIVHQLANGLTLKSLRDQFVIGAVFLAVISPWMVFLHLHYPDEIQLIFAQFLGRTGNSFEGHSGGLFFYLEDAMIIFGIGALFSALFVAYVVAGKKRPRHLLLLVWAICPLMILSLMSTKRSTYLIMSAPAYFIIVGLFICWFLRKEWKPWIKIVGITLLLGLPAQYSIERIKPFEQRFVLPEWRLNLERKTTWTTSIAYSYGYKKIVIDEVSHPYHLMFFRDNIIAYKRKLTEEEITQFEAAGFFVESVRARPRVQ